MTAGAVLLAVVLVVVLGGLAVRRVSDRWDGRRDALSADAVADEPAPGPGQTDDVAIVGDSITEMSDRTVHQVLDPQFHVRIRGRGGYRVEEMEPYAIELATSNPEQVVINLGTNDVLKNWPLDKSVSALDRMVKEFSGARCIHLVTINQWITNEADPGVRARAIVFNFAVRKIAADQHLDVIDWNAAIEADLKAGSPRGALTSDTIHPNATGQTALAQLYRAALDDCT